MMTTLPMLQEASVTDASETGFESSFLHYGQILRWRAAYQPDRLAYTFLSNGERPVRSYTYRGLDERVRAISTELMAHGAINERVLIVLPSDLDFTLTFLACLYSGAAAVTAVPPSTEEQLRRLNRIVGDSGAKVIVSSQKLIDRVSAQLHDCPDLHKATWLAIESIDDQRADEWFDPQPSWDSLALLQYTSGSTSAPKGVMITHRNLVRIGNAHEECFGVDKNDIGVSWIPQSHDMGLIFGVLQPLYTGFPAYLMTPMAFLKKPMRWLKAISEYRATVSIVPNFAYDMCVESVREEDFDGLDLSCFTLAANGAEPIRKSSYESFAKRFGPAGFRLESFSSAYGMAETTLAVSVGKRGERYRFRSVDIDMMGLGIVLDAPPESRSRDVVSCGRVASGVEVAIVNPRTLTRLPMDHVGEILIRGDLVGEGYWENEEATEEAFQVYTEDGEGPFLRTGDLGFVDEAGELYITGRAKDTIIIQGKNHSPQDIELTAELSDPAVRPRQVAAFSVVVAGGEVVVVIAEQDKGCHPDTNLEDVGARVARRIAREHQVPVLEIVFVKRGQCPKTSSGKVQRQRAKALYESREFTVTGSYRNPLFTSPV